MSRKYLSAGAFTVLIFFLLFLCLDRLKAVSHYDAVWRPHDGTLRGDSHITKGRYAEDKIVVMAQTSSENTSWVNDELPE